MRLDRRPREQRSPAPKDDTTTSEPDSRENAERETHQVHDTKRVCALAAISTLACTIDTAAASPTKMVEGEE